VFPPLLQHGASTNCATACSLSYCSTVPQPIALPRVPSPIAAWCLNQFHYRLFAPLVQHGASTNCASLFCLPSVAVPQPTKLPHIPLRSQQVCQYKYTPHISQIITNISAGYFRGSEEEYCTKSVKWGSVKLNGGFAVCFRHFFTLTTPGSYKLNSVVWVREWTIPTCDRRLSANLLSTSADRWYHVVSTTDPYGRILIFLDQGLYFFLLVAPQLYSRGWVTPFQTHYFSEHLLAPGIEPSPLDM
jgi:hypothetical protein